MWSAYLVWWQASGKPFLLAVCIAVSCSNTQFKMRRAAGKHWSVSMRIDSPHDVQSLVTIAMTCSSLAWQI